MSEFPIHQRDEAAMKEVIDLPADGSWSCCVMDGYGLVVFDRTHKYASLTLAQMRGEKEYAPNPLLEAFLTEHGLKRKFG